MSDPLVIAHINYHFFAPTETFIYFYLSRFRQTHPICLSWASPLVNIDKFPFPAADAYSYADTPVQRIRPAWTTAPAVQKIKRWLRPARRTQPAYRTHWAAEILRQRQARLIHAHFGTIGWQLLKLKKELNLPLVTTFYGFDVAPNIATEGPTWPQRRQELFDTGDLFLVEGPFMRERLIQLGCPPDKVEVQPIALPVSEIPFRPRARNTSGKTTLLFAGSFVEKKGLLDALRAIHELHAHRHDFEFRIIGDGKLAPEVKSFIQQHQLQDCVRLLGFLSHAEYRKEMNQADIFLHPSCVAADGDSEGGAPTVILEAQAMGLPVVSTRHADIPNVTVPGQSAILVAEHDFPALAQALTDLLDHPERWEVMGRAGRARIEQHHNLDHEVLRLEERYRQCVS